jgi:hypothetical protein
MARVMSEIAFDWTDPRFQREFLTKKLLHEHLNSNTRTDSATCFKILTVDMRMAEETHKPRPVQLQSPGYASDRTNDLRINRGAAQRLIDPLSPREGVAERREQFRKSYL